MDKEAIGLSRVQHFYLCVTCPPEICINLFFNIFMLLAVTQSVNNLFHLFIVLNHNKQLLHLLSSISISIYCGTVVIQVCGNVVIQVVGMLLYRYVGMLLYRL